LLPNAGITDGEEYPLIIRGEKEKKKGGKEEPMESLLPPRGRSRALQRLENQHGHLPVWADCKKRQIQSAKQVQILIVSQTPGSDHAEEEKSKRGVKGKRRDCNLNSLKSRRNAKWVLGVHHSSYLNGRVPGLRKKRKKKRGLSSGRLKEG